MTKTNSEIKPTVRFIYASLANDGKSLPGLKYKTAKRTTKLRDSKTY